MGRRDIAFHVHGANPLLGALDERPVATLAVVDGGCFFPSDWNCGPGEDPSWRAPTSYYATVQVTGRTRRLDGQELAELLKRQLEHFLPEGRIHRVAGTPPLETP